MNEDPEVVETATDTPLEPGTATPETEQEPDAPPATDEAGSEPTQEREPDLASPEAKHWQAAFTKARQKDRSEIEDLKGKLDRLLSALETRGVSAPPREEEPVNPQLDQILQRSPTIRRVMEENKALRESFSKMSATVAAQVLPTQHPELAGRIEEFSEWVGNNPELSRLAAAGALSDKALVGAFVAENPPAKPSRKASAPAKPAPALPHVAGPTRPAGVVRDIRETEAVRRLGKAPSQLSVGDVFMEAAKQAERELSSR